LKLPRWTVWPAMAVLAAFLVPAIPWRGGAATGAPRYPRVVVLGIDGLDPKILRETIALFPERMQNFRALIERGGLNELGTTTPPQSPVAWSSFITGLDPGGHGIFDFMHRDKRSRNVVPSTTTGPAEEKSLPLPWDDAQLPLGGDARSNRSGKAFWAILAEHGVPADIWRMPANFPVESSDG
jgi:hypothetical protein